MAPRTINTFPSSDTAFRRAVDRVVRESAPASPDELADRLRPLYPRVAVLQRDLEADRDAYYVFRDGGFSRRSAERWWENAGVACVCVSVETGRLTRVTDAWASLMGGQSQELVGRHFTDFVLPEARAAALGMFEAVAGDREVTTTALVMRVDGASEMVELHAARRDGEIEVHYRPVRGS
jgi:PAS domain S-box-containing protein